MKNKKELPECVDTALRMRLRSVYLKGHQDGNLRNSDLSWEDMIVKDIVDLFRKWKKEI